MENKKKQMSFTEWFRDKWSHNAMFSTIFALVVMTIVQSVALGMKGTFPKLGIAWMNILRNNTYAGVIALGMCFIIISGGIDLSVGSMLCALGACLMYLLDEQNGLLAAMGITGVPAYIIAIVIVLILGCILGALNGVLIAYGRIPPFIATLGTMKIFRSVTQQLTKQFNPTVPKGFKVIASAKIGGQIFLPIVYWLVIVIIMHIIFKKTLFGRQTIAIGSNERAAKLSGRIGSMDFANAGSGYEMDAIAAVIVGGTSMSGGRGSLIGAFLGMMIMGVMNNFLNTIGVPTFLCDAVKGLIIILAVMLQKKESD